MKIFLFNFYGFTIIESVLGSVPGVQRKWGLKLFGLVSLRGDFKLKTTLHRGLKLMVNKYTCILNSTLCTVLYCPVLSCRTDIYIIYVYTVHCKYTLAIFFKTCSLINFFNIIFKNYVYLKTKNIFSFY